MEDRRMHKARDFDAHASFIRFVIFKENANRDIKLNT